MASRIQGITVEIGGDTTKLSTALSKVNKEIRDTQAQLKDVNKLLKLDPGNAELMAQKQRLLSQAVSETKEKLDALKLAGQQANEALAKGEISRSQYDALQREIAETEQALRDLERQAEQSSVALQKCESGLPFKVGKNDQDLQGTFSVFALSFAEVKQLTLGVAFPFPIGRDCENFIRYTQKIKLVRRFLTNSQIFLIFMELRLHKIIGG